MLFLQFMLYSSSFVGTLKNEIPEAALELCQLKIKQFSPGILKFKTKYEANPFTLNCSVVPRSFLFVFHAGSRGLGSSQFGPCFQTIFPFLMTMNSQWLRLLAYTYFHE